MTRRERVMAMVVGGALCGLGLWAGIRYMVLSPLESYDKQIVAERNKQKKLQRQLRELDDVEERWQALTARTLGADAKEAQRAFREDMHMLLERHGLDEPKVSPGTFINYRDGTVGVPLNISAKGTLKDIVGLLCDFYRRDYLARLDNVRLTADQGVINSVNSSRGRASRSRSGRRGRTNRGRAVSFGPEGPTLRVSISAMTVVLPEIRDIPHQVMEEVEDLEHGRLSEERIAYNAIVDNNPFEPYQPPPPVVKKPDPPKPKEEPDQKRPEPVVKREPKVDPRANAGNMRLVASVMYGDEPRVYVADESKPTQKPEIYTHDDPIDDGTLLLIHRHGIVVRVQENGDTTDYYYELGGTFRDREELDPELHPEVAAALDRELLP